MWWASHLTARRGGTASPLATTIATSSSVKSRSIEASSSLSGNAAEIGELRRAQDLDAERMDEIHVADLADGRLQRRLAGQHAVAALASGDPVESEPRLVVVEDPFDADLPHHAGSPVMPRSAPRHRRRDGAHAAGSHRSKTSRTPAASVGLARLSRKLRLGEHLRELRQELQVLLGRLLRHEQHEHLRDRLAVGRVERDRRLQAHERALRLARARECARAGSRCPGPSPVEPSFSRACRLSTTTFFATGR